MLWELYSLSAVLFSAQGCTFLAAINIMTWGLAIDIVGCYVPGLKTIMQRRKQDAVKPVLLTGPGKVCIDSANRPNLVC